jgi:phage protein D
MDLAEYSDRHGDFYVPAFVVKVGGRALTQDLGVGVSQCEVDLTLGAASRFSFTVVNTWSLERREFRSAGGMRVIELLAFGSSIDVAMGYGDCSRLPVLLSGLVTEITTSFSEGGTPELVVSGYDHLFPMTLGKGSHSWPDVKDSDVVAELAQAYGLAADIEETSPRHAQIEKNQESDFEFMKKLAERNHYEFYVTPRKALRFGKPRDREEGIVTLRWGDSLFSFKPEANLAGQVSKVEVYGWDTERKRAIVGVARAGEESGHDPRRQSGGTRLQAAIGRETVLQVRQPVFSQAEARQRAQAILNDRAKKFLTGDAECLGLPELLPDRNVTLGNLGEPFSKTYYVKQATHKVDGSGYRTRLKMKETSL